MRIRFVTKAQLQVLQASKTEKHLMPDGPIPLFGSLPSAVSRQWGYSNGCTKTWVATLPISSSSSYAALAGDAGGGAFPIGANANTNTICFYQQIDNATGLFYLVISKV